MYDRDFDYVPTEAHWDDDPDAPTAAQWDAIEARWKGEEHPDKAWILSDRDVWHPNPHYQGPPVPHPEDWSPEDADPNYDPEWFDAPVSGHIAEPLDDLPF